MCVLNGSQVYWTIEVQDAFAGLKDDPDCIKDASEMLQKQVLDYPAPPHQKKPANQHQCCQARIRIDAG